MFKWFSKQNAIWIVLGIISILFHIVVLLSLRTASIYSLKRKNSEQKIQLSINQKQKLVETIPTVLSTPVPVLTNTPKPKKKSVKLPIESKEKPTPPPVSEVKPIHGLNANSFSTSKDSNNTFSVPAGNSLMIEDEGVRVAPEIVQTLPPSSEEITDRSERARIDISTLKKPAYTNEAIQSNLNGIFLVDVFVNKEGIALDVELVKKVGHGMDERIKEAILQAKFFPERDSKGNPLEGWFTMQFKLEIP